MYLRWKYFALNIRTQLDEFAMRSPLIDDLSDPPERNSGAGRSPTLSLLGSTEAHVPAVRRVNGMTVKIIEVNGV